MDFALSPEQQQIQDMSLAFARDQLAPNALDWDRDGHFPADIVRQTAELGMGAIYVREDVGGSN